MFRDLGQEKERSDLREQVIWAFNNRTKEEYRVADISAGQRVKEKIGKLEDENEVIDLPYTPMANTATTDNLKDYHWLLRYAAEECFKHAGQVLTPELRRKFLKKDLAHEFEHALKGKNEDGLIIKYAVSFSESPDGDSVSWRPGIVLTGQARRGTIRRIASAATNLSKGDKVALG